MDFLLLIHFFYFSRPPIHSATGCRYFHEITLRDNPPFHSLATWVPERLSGLRAKRIQRQPQKALTLHTFLMPVIMSPFDRCFSGVFRVLTNTGKTL